MARDSLNIASQREITTEDKMIDVPVLSDSADKTYMSVWAITDQTSRQYDYIWNSGEVTIDEYGYLICATGYYGAALGSRFGPVGSKYIFTLDSGAELKICKVEAKADKDTDDVGFAAHDGHVIEFVIDTQTPYMTGNIAENGFVFGGNFNNVDEFSGRIVKVQEVIENETTIHK